MKKPLFRAAVLTSALAAGLAPLTPVLAQTLTITDGTSDAWEEVRDTTTGDTTYVEAGSPVNSDLVRTTVRHTNRVVKVRSKFVDLRNNDEGVVMGVKIRTNEGLRRIGFVLKDGTASGSDAVLLKPSGGGVRCAGLKREVDWAADAVELVVPRACLSKPRWVQVVVAAGNYAGDGRRSYIDVAGKAGHAFSGWSDKIRRG